MAEKAVKKEAPTKYSKRDLMENAAVFKVMPEIVAAALTGKTEATKEETEKAIKEFLEKPKEPKKKGAK